MFCLSRMNLRGQVCVFALSLLVIGVVGPPVKEQKPGENEVDDTPERFTMEYARYLQEVVQTLEEDESFRNKLQNASEDDIKSGRIAQELDLVGHHVRNRLDELKRTELDRIRQLTRQQMELEQGFDRRQLKVPKHLDHRNEHTFEIEDLKRLILQTTKDLEETDRKRRKDFKEYELEKEHQRLEKLKALDEEHKKKAQEEWEEQQRKHREHPKLHHPGSKQQMEEVWEKQDHLPKEEFDHKTFFRMHDLNGDKYWSQEEVNALFQNELNKMYDPNAPEDDIRERYEEMERMREHVFNETDTDRDGQISFDEFIVQTKKQQFEEDPGWQGLDEEPIFSQDEFQEYERRRMEEMARMAAAGINPYGGHPSQGMGQPHYMPPVYPGPVYQQPLPPHHGAPMHQQQQQMHHQQQQPMSRQQQQIPHHQQQQMPHHQQQQMPHHQQQQMPHHQQQQMPHHQQQMAQQQYHQAQLQQHPKAGDGYQAHGAGMHDAYQQQQQQFQQQQFQQQQQQFQQQQHQFQQQQQHQQQQFQQQQQQAQQKQQQPVVVPAQQSNLPQPPAGGAAQVQTAAPLAVNAQQGQTVAPSQPVANVAQSMTAAPILSNSIDGQAAQPVVPPVNMAGSNKVPLTARK